ncbi:hypothetical protein [Pseudomonas saxonica]|uniref:Uncharacterized protein n=1 Tax=Pseudomonas saxonica TaxID=2600598 RepID=A0A5C5PWS1_9PSED|nr:hypothetical protein [Pseudomonas saxonica]TWR93488.1 hypothetical protein FJD37_12590 [Pseudomonas saxonica]
MIFSLSLFGYIAGVWFLPSIASDFATTTTTTTTTMLLLACLRSTTELHSETVFHKAASPDWLFLADCLLPVVNDCNRPIRVR